MAVVLVLAIWLVVGLIVSLIVGPILKHLAETQFVPV
jgi:hypothetical protein